MSADGSSGEITIDWSGTLKRGLRPRLETVLDGVPLEDGVAIGAVKPYASFGPHDILSLDGDGLRSVEVSLQIDVWTDGLAKGEAERLCALVRAAIDRRYPRLDEAELVEIRVPSVTVRVEADAMTVHGIVTVRALLEA